MPVVCWYTGIQPPSLLISGSAIQEIIIPDSIFLNNSIMATERITKHISYANYEKKILNMEDYLMEHFMCDRSALHKRLVKEKYQAITLME